MKKVFAIGCLSVFAFCQVAVPESSAMELDWSGQFRGELHLIHNYTLDGSDSGPNTDSNRAGKGGYYIPGGGSNDANFRMLFLKLRPKLVVNDNIYIKSEWWLGNPIFGFFGSSTPYSQDQRYYYSTQSRGSTISAQRFWAEFLSDIGTVQVGRAPLHWGLGLVWNNGDGLWDRYESTGDAIRLISKFGAFSIIPSYISYSAGNSIGGSCTGDNPCVASFGSGGVSEYSLIFKYENIDEDYEAGVNFIRRLAGNNPDPVFGYYGPSGKTAGMTFNTWDIYARKSFGRLTLSGELPITSGDLGGEGINYSTVALATELNWKISSTWETLLKLGRAPGQPSGGGPALQKGDKYQAFYFNPNYRLGLVMFNYQFANFSGPNTSNNPRNAEYVLKSPFDNPITNANYLALGGAANTDKWTFRAGLVFAKADKTAVQGQYFFNSWERKFENNTSGKDQGSSLGWEMDYGTTFRWDEYFQFGLDFGFWFPGDFYKFSNTPSDNMTSTVFATAAKVGVSF